MTARRGQRRDRRLGDYVFASVTRHGEPDEDIWLLPVRALGVCWVVRVSVQGEHGGLALHEVPVEEWNQC